MSRHASGRSIALRNGPYTAQIASVGSSLRSLQWHDRDLVVPYGHDEVRPHYSGALLAPWPNRVVDGRWTWRASAQRLPLTEPERGHALHGLALWFDWMPQQVTRTSVTLRTTICPQPGYPFLLDLRASWRLSSRGLGCRLTAVNRGADVAPYGCGVHPYLVGGSGSLDSWYLQVPARRQLQVDARLAPTRLTPPAAGQDFRAPRRIDGAKLDNAYTDIDFDSRDRAHISVTDEAGFGSAIEFDTSCPWAQICTTALPDEDGAARGVAAEPMTCPPNALQSGQDLVMLAPGGRHTVRWRIFARHA